MHPDWYEVWDVTGDVTHMQPLTLGVLGNNPDRMNNTWNVSENGQEDVDPEMHPQADRQKYTHRR
jgi:hypothetical protein